MLQQRQGSLKGRGLMAIEGTYKVELTTTLGNENIILTLDTFGDLLNG